MKAILALITVSVWAVSAIAITIPTVRIGNVGNANDPLTGNLIGGVSHAYNIGKHEVTVGQYVEFLTAVAAADTYGLYNPLMQTDLNIAGISRSGFPGSYMYSVIGSANHPVTYVSWGDAARFANWLHNGQPTGPQINSTTEDGAYSLNGATSNAALALVTRNPGAKSYIPTENEWYKAAYYQPLAQGGDADNYWAYPMRSNSVPFSDQPPGATPDNTRVGNLHRDDGLANGYNDGYAVTGVPNSAGIDFTQNYLTDVGAYTSSPNFYGTFDQGGNVWEWNETLFSGSFRGLRGASWFNDPLLSSSQSPRTGNPANEGSDTGFRVVSVIPEPSTLLLLCLGALGFVSIVGRHGSS